MSTLDLILQWGIYPSLMVILTITMAFVVATDFFDFKILATTGSIVGMCGYSLIQLGFIAI